MDYQLEIKQIVDYPRCRIYRKFVQNLMKDRSIRTSGCSYLFYYIVLCSYANFRSSYRRLDGITYLVEPGQWICTATELSEWFRTRFQHQAVSILDALEKQHYISYSKLGRGNLIKFSISGWKTSNTALEYNYPCLKDVGFFFFPIAAAHELISLGKCSEMDIVLDLWLHTIYQDGQVQGSDKGPVVYFRNGTGNPLTNFSDLAQRWGISKSTVSRILNKLENRDYLSLISFPGRHGSVIYLNNYLSTMFQVSDVMIDKEEVSMAFHIPFHAPDSSLEITDSPIRDEQISVPSEDNSVSKPHMHAMVRKVAKVLATQGLPCCECSRTIYKLYPLSDCMEGHYRYSLEIICPDGWDGYHFELTLSPAKGQRKSRKTGCRTEGTADYRFSGGQANA